MTRVKHQQARTVQVKQYEPRTFTFEIEDEVPSDAVSETMDGMKVLLDKKIDDAVNKLQEGLKQETGSSK